MGPLWHGRILKKILGRGRATSGLNGERSDLDGAHCPREIFTRKIRNYMYGIAARTRKSTRS